MGQYYEKGIKIYMENAYLPLKCLDIDFDKDEIEDSEEKK